MLHWISVQHGKWEMNCEFVVELQGNLFIFNMLNSSGDVYLAFDV